MMETQPKILVVDDMANWREMLRDILESEGYLVYTAASFSEAKAVLQKRTFHVAVLDVRLIDADETNMDGLSLLEEINTHWGKTRTIVVTGYGRSVEVRTAFNVHRVFDFFEKHAFDTQYFREAVAMAVEAAEGTAGAQWG